MNIVLLEPEIPQNTGNIVRTAAATGSVVHLIEPLGFDISEKADKYAYMIRDAFKNKGFDFIVDSPTNQQFPILDNKSLDALKKNYAFSVWAPVGDKTAVRFCTSWATTEEDVKALIADIEAL